MRDEITRFLSLRQTEQLRSVHTIAAYRADLTQFIEFVEQHTPRIMHNWAAITDETLHAYRSFLQTHPLGYRPSTVTRKVAAVKSLFAYLYGSGIISINPAHSWTLVKTERATPLTIGVAEMHRLLNTPRGRQSAPTWRDKALLELLCATGLQVTELVNLNVSDLDLVNHVLHCGTTAKRRRTLPLYTRTATALRSYLNEARQDLLIDRSQPALWLNQRGQRLTRQGLWLIVKRHVQQAGITTAVTPQILRHSFAAHQLQAGVPLQSIRNQLGYARLSSTRVYQRAANKGIAELEIDGVPLK